MVLAVALLWAVLRSKLGDGYFPLTFVLPLMLCVWTRRAWHLWMMAGFFVAVTLVRYWRHDPISMPVFTETVFFVATLLNIAVGAGIIYLILRLRERLDAETRQVERKNGDLAAQAEQLHQQNEEIKAQAEELTEQNNELESQAEELERQNQELTEANERLGNREEVLRAAVECTRVAGGARTALEAVCRRTLAIIGAPAGALALLELQGVRLKARVRVEIDQQPPLPEEWPLNGSLGDVVLHKDQTAYVDDLQRRPDLSAPFDGAGQYRSALATPIRLSGQAAGVLVVCSPAPTHWTQEQFRLVEWAAAQVAPLLDSLRWQEALQKRADAIESANQAKDQFLAMLSHELRTPLTPVLAAAGALEGDSRLPDDVQEEIAMIRRNVAVQSRLIDDLLDLTRISRGKLDLIQQPVPMLPLLREAAAIVAADLDAKEQSLDVDLTLPNSCVALGDAARLQQVFWNILKNGIKFSPRGSRLRLEATVRPGHPRIANSEGERIVVRITDQGVGIDGADLERIFRPFEQAAAARRRGGNEGLGLGLSIAKALVDLHDGRLYANSDGAGCGAVFTVELPLLRESSNNGTPLSAAPTENQSSKGDVSRARVLLVEDHLDTGRIIARLLRRSGHTVVHAETVSAAWSAWESEQFDLIVSDLGLPDGSGLDLMRRIREADSGVPAICMSGFGMESDVSASRDAGFTEHLIKPVDMTQLHAAIRRLISAVSAS